MNAGPLQVTLSSSEYANDFIVCTSKDLPEKLGSASRLWKMSSMLFT